MSLLGIVFGSGMSSPKVGVVKEDSSKLTTQISKIIKKIEALEYIEGEKSKMLNDLKEGKIDAVIVFPKKFGDSLPLKVANVDIYNDPSATFTSGIVEGILKNILQEVNTSITKSPTLLTVKNHNVRQKGLDYIDFLLPGIIAMTLMNSALFGLGGMVVRYRERGILKRIRVTTQPLYQFLGAHIVSQVFFALLRSALLIIVAVYIFKAKMFAGMLPLLVVILLGSVCFITISLTIASFSKNREVADTMANIFSMPMMFLSGVFFPVDNVPFWIKPLIKILPLKYLTDALRGIMVRGLNLASVEKELIYLGLITIGFFIISIKTFRWE